MRKSKLTTRQWHLYNFLKLMYENNPDAFVTKEGICHGLPQDYEIKENETRTCRSIEIDINALRNSDEIYKVIVSNHDGYKIASEDEANDWLARVKVEALRKLKMYWKNLKYAESNNQMRLVFNKEKDTIEVF